MKLLVVKQPDSPIIRLINADVEIESFDLTRYAAVNHVVEQSSFRVIMSSR